LVEQQSRGDRYGCLKREYASRKANWSN
jgi:hypothetical protein